MRYKTVLLSLQHDSFVDTLLPVYSLLHFSVSTSIISEAAASTLLDGARDDVEWERFLAAVDKDSGALLHASPSNIFCGFANG